MGLYKWIFKKLTGVDLVDPDPNFIPEENDAEIFLDGNPSWPKEVGGEFSLIDSSGDDEHCFYWVIGTLEMPGFEHPILLEFKDKILIESGLNKLEEFPGKIKVQINPSVMEYYQVAQYQKT